MKVLLTSFIFFLLTTSNYILSGDPDCHDSKGGAKAGKESKKKRKGPPLKLHIPPRSYDSFRSIDQGGHTSVKFSPANTSRVSPIIVPSRFVIVVDFDNCLVKKNISSKVDSSPFSMYVPERNDFALSDPKKAFNNLLDQYPTVGLVIASFGFSWAINNSLAYLLENRFKEDKRYVAMTPASCGSEDGTSQLGNKNQMFKMLSEQAGIPYENMIFFDDNEKNVEDARQLGIKSILANPFSDCHLELARKFFDEKTNTQYPD